MPHNAAFQCKDVPFCWVAVIQKIGGADSISALKWSRMSLKLESHLCPVSGQDIIAVHQNAHARSPVWQPHLPVSGKSPYWLLFPPTEDWKWEKTVKWQTLERATLLVPNEWRCHDSSAWILQRTDGPLLISESSRSLWRSFIHKQRCCCCWCLNWLFVLVFGLKPTGIQLSSGWGGDASIFHKILFSWTQDTAGSLELEGLELKGVLWEGHWGWPSSFPLDGLWWLLVMFSFSFLF